MVIWGTHFSKSFTFKPSDKDHKVGDFFVTMTRIADFYSAQPKWKKRVLFLSLINSEQGNYAFPNPRL